MDLYALSSDLSALGGLFGRTEICTPVDTITRENVVSVLTHALSIHSGNRSAIDYLYRYRRGEQPILGRSKTIRPEICNRIVENHAAEICQFISSYCMGEPVTYVRRGKRESASESIEKLNDYMYFEGKATVDKRVMDWAATCGVGYKMILPDADSAEDEAPFSLDAPDPRDTFVVYHTGFGHKPVMGVRSIYRSRSGKTDTDVDTICCGYTTDHYFETVNGALRVWQPHLLGGIPIIEYDLNTARMGSFEPALSLLDAINTVTSNRIDGVEQFVQSLMKFINCDVDDEDIKKIQELGAIKLRSFEGMNADVQILTQELNQMQVQTLIDYLYDQVLTICGVPTTKKGGTSTSDTGTAVLLRDGFQQTEARAKDTELLYRMGERSFLRLALNIIRNSDEEFDLKLSEIECKFTRRQLDNLQSKAQALLAQLQAGIAPQIAIAHCGMYNDPADVAAQSAQYLKKWDYVDPVDDVDEFPDAPDVGRGRIVAPNDFSSKRPERPVQEGPMGDS